MVHYILYACDGLISYTVRALCLQGISVEKSSESVVHEGYRANPHIYTIKTQESCTYHTGHYTFLLHQVLISY